MTLHGEVRLVDHNSCSLMCCVGEQSVDWIQVTIFREVVGLYQQGHQEVAGASGSHGL